MANPGTYDFTLQRRADHSFDVNLKDGNNVEANKSFDNAMKEKLANALDAEKINIASQMVSKKSEEE